MSGKYIKKNIKNKNDSEKNIVINNVNNITVNYILQQK